MQDDKKGAPPPGGELPSELPPSPPESDYHPNPPTGESYGSYEDPYAYHPGAIEAPKTESPPENAVVVATAPGGTVAPPPPPAPPADGDEEDEEEEGMLRMSFMEHLEELRIRIIRALMGLAVAFVFSLVFAGK